MTTGFVGRERELARLDQLLGKIAPRPYDAGQAVAIRGRRRVGKTRLIREFIDRAGVPSVEFFASGADPARELARFRDALRDSGVSRAATAAGTPESWSAALEQLAAVLPDDAPTVVVIDETPYLARADDSFEGALQAAWDTRLSRLPVLLVLIGSDVSAMERMTTYGRPFHQRAVEMEIRPLGVRDVATMTGLAAADAFDAYLVTGGLPLLLAEWGEGQGVREYLRASLAEPSSGLITSGIAALAAEFPPEAKAKQVLRAIGSGDTAFAKILGSSGLEYASTLTSALEVLIERRIVERVEPLSAKPAKRATQYRVTDPYLRFFAAFIDEDSGALTGGFWRPTLARIDRSWQRWRGIAVEPVVRELLHDQWGRLLPEFESIGSWWSANGSTEVDIVLGDKPVPRRVLGAGSIKWRDSKPFGAADLADLRNDARLIPGADADTALIAVSRTPVEVGGVIAIGPDDLLSAG